jgi:hypothetical protein
VTPGIPTTRLKLLEVTPSIVSLNGWLPGGVAAVVWMVTGVLLPVVTVVPSEIPATLFVLFSAIVEPLAIFAVVTVQVALPAVPAVSVPDGVPAETVLGNASGFTVTPTIGKKPAVAPLA